MSQGSGNGQSTDVLLDDEQRAVCEQLTGAEAPHGQRAQALLALDEGTTQAAAADGAGLTKDQVRYWLRRFRQNGLGIFPEELVNQARPEMATTGALLDDEQRAVCEQLASGEAPHGQRAQALLALDEGATQTAAGDRAGLTKNQVKYWLGRFRKNGLSIFPEDLVDQARPEVVSSPAGDAAEAESAPAEAEVALDVGESVKVKKKKSKKGKGKSKKAKKSKKDKKSKKKSKKKKQSKKSKKKKKK